MTLPPRINLVTLGVADLEASSAFYERLGWRRGARGGEAEVRFFALSGLVLALFSRQALADDAKVPNTPPGFGGIALAINLPSEAAVDDGLAAAAAAGARILKPAERTSWGGYSGYFADPDGHPWEVAYNPGFPLNADGRIVLPD